MAMDEAHRYLKSLPLFADFDRHDFDHLDPISTDLDLSAGTVVMKEGSTSREMVVVLEGTLEVTRHGEHVADIGVGGFAGEMGLLSGAPRNSTVTTKTDCRLLQIDGRSFANLLEQVPHLAVKMLPVIATRVAQLVDDHATG